MMHSIEFWHWRSGYYDGTNQDIWWLVNQNLSTSFRVTQFECLLWKIFAGCPSLSINSPCDSLALTVCWQDFTTLSILWQLGQRTHSLYFYNSGLEVVFSLWPPSLHPSIPFLLLHTSPSQPMESQTTAAVRQWSFCKYHCYICVSVYGSEGHYSPEVN